MNLEKHNQIFKTVSYFHIFLLLLPYTIYYAVYFFIFYFILSNAFPIIDFFPSVHKYDFLCVEGEKFS